MDSRTFIENFKKNYLCWDFIRSLLYIFSGCFVFSLGAVLFVEPYGFAPGGTYGIAMVFHHLFGWRTEVAALCMDIPLLVIGTLVIGHQFGVKTLISTLVMPASMFIIHEVYGYAALLDPGVTDITLMENQLLAALCGGIVYGVGLGLVYKSMATSGGTDIIAMIFRKYFHMSMGTATLIIDGVVVLSSVVAFGDWTLPLYSGIVVFLFSQLIDRFIEGEPSRTMFIISDHIDEIRDVIINEMGRGATLIPGKGLYEGVERDIIYVVLSRREMVSLRYRIAKIDPRAFINVMDSAEILGEGFKDINQY